MGLNGRIQCLGSTGTECRDRTHSLLDLIQITLELLHQRMLLHIRCGTPSLEGNPLHTGTGFLHLTGPRKFLGPGHLPHSLDTKSLHRHMFLHSRQCLSLGTVNDTDRIFLRQALADRVDIGQLDREMRNGGVVVHAIIGKAVGKSDTAHHITTLFGIQIMQLDLETSIATIGGLVMIYMFQHDAKMFRFVGDLEMQRDVLGHNRQDPSQSISKGTRDIRIVLHVIIRPTRRRIGQSSQQCIVMMFSISKAMHRHGRLSGCPIPHYGMLRKEIFDNSRQCVCVRDSLIGKTIRQEKDRTDPVLVVVVVAHLAGQFFCGRDDSTAEIGGTRSTQSTNRIQGISQMLLVETTQWQMQMGHCGECHQTKSIVLLQLTQ
mmetsp:Transcript_3916/g.8852  ORF Transcript_3916/g.8852 Transcript_3916/m.8852 type:complete len:375 (-) Transcript_3916:372-1496(-)